MICDTREGSALGHCVTPQQWSFRKFTNPLSLDFGVPALRRSCRAMTDSVVNRIEPRRGRGLSPNGRPRHQLTTFCPALSNDRCPAQVTRVPREEKQATRITCLRHWRPTAVSRFRAGRRDQRRWRPFSVDRARTSRHLSPSQLQFGQDGSPP